MSDSSAASVSIRRPLHAKHLMWGLFILMTLFVALTRERSLLDAASFLRQRYAPIKWLMLAHGVPGALALVLGAFQFSSRLRQRHLQWHRVLGRIYVAAAAVSAPVAIVVSYRLPIPSLFMASIIQSGGWLLATGTALRCVRQGKIQQHREWMMRGYPFAMVFVVARVVLSVPAIQRMGLFGVVTVVWSTIALAGILPSFLIAWQAMGASKRA